MWRMREGGSTIYLVRVSKGGLDKSEGISSMHEQVGKVLGLDLEVLVSAAQVSEVE